MTKSRHTAEVCGGREVTGCVHGKAEAEGHSQDSEVAQGDDSVWGRDKDCAPGAMAKSAVSENTCQGGH